MHTNQVSTMTTINAEYIMEALTKFLRKNQADGTETGKEEVVLALGHGPVQELGHGQGVHGHEINPADKTSTPFIKFCLDRLLLPPQGEVQAGWPVPGG